MNAAIIDKILATSTEIPTVIWCFNIINFSYVKAQAGPGCYSRIYIAPWPGACQSLVDVGSDGRGVCPRFYEAPLSRELYSPNTGHKVPYPVRRGFLPPRLGVASLEF